MLEQYERVLPGSAKQILDAWHDQGKHRMDLERTVVKGDNQRATAGMWLGAVVALAHLGVGGFLINSGHDVAGGAIVTSTIAAILGAFVKGTNSRRAERESKAQNVPPPRKRS